MHITETRPGMSAPIGCGYRGNDYWRVWVMNRLWGGDQIGCIRRMTSNIETEGGMAYSVQLKGFAEHRGDNRYCV